MSDNSNDNDWGMTMPNARLDDEMKKEAAAQAKSKPEVPSLPPDDWGISSPNVNVPPNAVPPSNQVSNQPLSDFDKTTPNINIPPQNQGQSSAPVPPVPPAADDWGLSQPNINVPRDGKKDDWQMPPPKFQVSEGATPNFDRTTPNINLRDIDGDFTEAGVGGNTTPYYRLPENQSETPAAAVAAAQAPPVDAPPAEAAPAAAPKSGNMKWILMLGGLFTFFLLLTAGLVGAYFLYFETPNTVRSNANRPVETTAPPTNAPPTNAPIASTLPASVNYKGDMVLVAAGEFTMGSDTGGDESKPAHKVTVPAFYIDKTEVTNAQYKAFCDATGKTPPTDPFWEKGYFEKRPNAPVLGVSFDDAKAFAEWSGKRLPSETEWEKAASWNESAQSKLEFPWGASFEAGKSAFGLNTTKDVGAFSAGASPAGALDMAGNVAEWVDAFFQPYPGNTTANANFGQTNRIVRGGHFGAKSNDLLKTTRRIYVPPTIASGEDEEKLFAAAIGFRCAVSADDARLAEVLRK